jgi:L-rhamnose mutarotase
MKRMCSLINLKPEVIAEYKRVHQTIWPEILDAITACNIKNYTIFLREPENLLIGYWEYHGTDFQADMEKMKSAPLMQEWWKITDAMQTPLDSRNRNEWWSATENVFHTD